MGMQPEDHLCVKIAECRFLQSFTEIAKRPSYDYHFGKDGHMISTRFCNSPLMVSDTVTYTRMVTRKQLQARLRRGPRRPS